VETIGYNYNRLEGLKKTWKSLLRKTTCSNSNHSPRSCVSV